MAKTCNELPYSRQMEELPAIPKLLAWKFAEILNAAFHIRMSLVSYKTFSESHVHMGFRQANKPLGAM